MIARGIIEPSAGRLRLSATIFSSIAPMNAAAIPSWKPERMRMMEEKALSVSHHGILEFFSAGLPYLDSNRGLVTAWDHDDRSLFNEPPNDPRITCIFLLSARFGEFSLYRRVSDHNEVEVLSETCAGDVSCVFENLVEDGIWYCLVLKPVDIPAFS